MLGCGRCGRQFRLLGRLCVYMIACLSVRPSVRYPPPFRQLLPRLSHSVSHAFFLSLSPFLLLEYF